MLVAGALTVGISVTDGVYIGGEFGRDLEVSLDAGRTLTITSQNGDPLTDVH
jgi:hypothetical protein